MATARRSPARDERCPIVLFHSALGLRTGVLEWANRLRTAGYAVHTPDLYQGVVCDTVPDGVQALREVGGLAVLRDRALTALSVLPQAVAYAGFSIGAELAALMCLVRPEALGAVLMHGAFPGQLTCHSTWRWPSTVPVQVHFSKADPFRVPAELEVLRSIVERSGAGLELHEYPGAGHLFADPGLPDFDSDNAQAMEARVLRFLDRLERPATDR